MVSKQWTGVRGKFMRRTGVWKVCMCLQGCGSQHECDVAVANSNGREPNTPNTSSFYITRPRHTPTLPNNCYRYMRLAIQ